MPSLAVAVIASAEESPGARLERQVRVMERVVDEILVQSENAAVSGLGSTRGLVLDGYGALFTVETSVIGSVAFPDGSSSFAVTVGEGWAPRAPRAPRGAEEKELHEIQKQWKEQREKTAKEQKERMDALITEVKGALLDYGGTLGELGNESRVTIAVFWGGRASLGRASEQRLLITAQMRDLRAHLAGNLDRTTALGRITVESTAL